MSICELLSTIMNCCTFYDILFLCIFHDEVCSNVLEVKRWWVTRVWALELSEVLIWRRAVLETRMHRLLLLFDVIVVNNLQWGAWILARKQKWSCCILILWQHKVWWVMCRVASLPHPTSIAVCQSIADYIMAISRLSSLLKLQPWSVRGIGIPVWSLAWLRCDWQIRLSRLPYELLQILIL